MYFSHLSTPNTSLRKKKLKIKFHRLREEETFSRSCSAIFIPFFFYSLDIDVKRKALIEKRYEFVDKQNSHRI
jgi:hypothetical protein